MKNRFVKRISTFIFFILFLWGGLTLWAEREGPENIIYIGPLEAPKTALIVYDPDPIYNLDEQVCQRFAAGLASTGDWRISVSTVSAAEAIAGSFDLYVFCANTYNWAPDRAISRFIRRSPHLEDRPVAAITLGSGSTGRSQRIFEQLIINQKANLIESRSYWLMRTNDEQRMEDPNTTVAGDMAEAYGREMADKLSTIESGKLATDQQ